MPLIAVAIAVSVGASTAQAQTISNLTITKNGTNSADQLTATGNMKTQTASTVAVQSSSALAFGTRYAFLVGNDRDGGLQILGNTNTQTLNSSYTISFQVTAPGAYRLHIGTALNAEVNRRDDGGGSAGGELNPLTGSFTGGTLQSGSLSLAGTQSIGNGSGNANVVVDRDGSAVIQGVSNGSPVNHTLTFNFSSTCRSIAAIFGSSGEECAVRGGISSSISGYTAGVYPGTPARTAATDGHFVSVSLESLCNNGTVDAGVEDCDLTGQNGNPGVCCTSACLFKTAGTECRAQNGICDVAESCTGASEFCPADAVEAPTTVCRAAEDLCDTVEYCDGTNKLCGPDLIEPTTTVCRPVAGACDAQDFCDGANKACPTDQVLPSSVLCRPAAGICDVADFCPGDAPDCSEDVREPATTICRPSIEDGCDLDDYCDGGVDCSPDLGEPDNDGDGLCDDQDNCPGASDPTFADDDADGVGNVCDPCTNVLPVDIVNPTILVKRLNTPPGDDTLKFTGTVTVPTSPAIDPIAKGVRFRFEDPDGVAVLDVTIPGGAYNNALRSGWKATPAGWKYKNVGRIVPLVSGISTITLTKDRKIDGKIKFQIVGKKGDYVIFPEEIPLKVSMVIDAPFAQTGQCGEAILSSADCAFDAGPKKLQCENPN